MTGFDTKMPHLLNAPFALLSDGTVVINLGEVSPEPHDLTRMLQQIEGPLFVGVPATKTEIRQALHHLEHGHYEAASLLIARRKALVPGRR